MICSGVKITISIGVSTLRSNTNKPDELINQAEFGIQLTDIQQVDHVTWVMKRMLDAFEKPFQIKGNEIYTSAYFGVSIFPHDGQTVDELYSNANNACNYAQKLKGRDRYLFSSPSLNEKAVNLSGVQLRQQNLAHRIRHERQEIVEF